MSDDFIVIKQMKTDNEFTIKSMNETLVLFKVYYSIREGRKDGRSSCKNLIPRGGGKSRRRTESCNAALR